MSSEKKEPNKLKVNSEKMLIFCKSKKLVSLM